MTRVAVIIVNYNTGEEAVACAASAAAELAAVVSETIVVDNASSDGSVERLRAGAGVTAGSDGAQAAEYGDRALDRAADYADQASTRAADYAEHADQVSARAADYAEHADQVSAQAADYAEHADQVSAQAADHAEHADQISARAADHAEHADQISARAADYAEHAGQASTRAADPAADYTDFADQGAVTPGARPGSGRDPIPIRVVANATNRGFGAAVNQAARLTDAPLLWILNPDCRVLPGAFAALWKTLDGHPDCAIAAPQLLNDDGSVQASARGEPGAWTGLFGRHGLLTKWFPSAGAARRNLPAADLVTSGVESAPVDWVMGASMLIRRVPFDQVGGFDEGYFLYWEDADLCRRLRDAGFTTRYVPGARVRHAGGASARTDARRAIHAFHDSAYRYYTTHVVRSPWHPARGFAKIALALRARWRSR